MAKLNNLTCDLQSNSYKMFRTVPNTYEMLNKFWYIVGVCYPHVCQKNEDKILKEKYNFCGQNIPQLYYYFLKY